MDLDIHAGRGARRGSFSLATTAAVTDADRFDYWRRLFFASYIDRRRAELARPFDGRVLQSHHYEGVSFAHIAVDPVVCEFGLRDCGLMLLGQIRSGSVEVTERDDRRHVLSRQDGLVLFDCDRRATLATPRYEVSYLILPRYLAVDALGGEPAPADGAVRRVRDTPIARLLSQHLDAIGAAGGGMDGTDAYVALKAATDMAIAALSHDNPALRHTDRSTLAAAKTFIANNFARTDLTAVTIARGVGCSRTHLYRVFERAERNIGEHLRQVRLDHAHRLLQCERHASIADIAYRSGYADATAFGKAFRRRYGLTPGEHRATGRDAAAAGDALRLDATAARA